MAGDKSTGSRALLLLWSVAEGRDGFLHIFDPETKLSMCGLQLKDLRLVDPFIGTWCGACAAFKPKGINELHAAAERFHMATQEVVATLATESGVVSNSVRIAIQATAQDVYAFVELFAEPHVLATRASSNQTRHVANRPGRDLDADTFLEKRISPTEMGELVTHFEQSAPLMQASVHYAGRLMVAYKAMFLLLRAFQDALYRLLNALLGGSGGTMSAAQAPRNRVGVLLRANRPTYLPWFGDWKARRNQIKEGATFHLALPEHDMGVRFNVIDRRTGNLRQDLSPQPVRIAEVVTALEESTDVVMLALSVRGHDPT